MGVSRGCERRTSSKQAQAAEPDPARPRFAELCLAFELVKPAANSPQHENARSRLLAFNRLWNCIRERTENGRHAREESIGSTRADPSRGQGFGPESRRGRAARRYGSPAGDSSECRCAAPGRAINCRSDRTRRGGRDAGIAPRERRDRRRHARGNPARNRMAAGAFPDCLWSSGSGLLTRWPRLSNTPATICKP